MHRSLRDRLNCKSPWWWFPGVVMALLLTLAGCTKDPEYVNVSVVRSGSTVATFKAELAVTREERAQGLSGRVSLKDGHGMLFIFPEPGFYEMWMPDMNFPLDFLFIDESKTIVAIHENMQPCAYRDDCPSIWGGIVLYVLEIPAGSVERYGIRLGDRIVF